MSHRLTYFRLEHQVSKGTVAVGAELEREGDTIGVLITLAGDEDIVVRLEEMILRLVQDLFSDLVAEYRTQLPEKELLHQKLCVLFEAN